MSQVSIGIKKDELAELDKAAEAAGMSREDYARSLLLGTTTKGAKGAKKAGKAKE